MVSVSAWRDLLVGIWQSDTKHTFQYPCYTFTPEGRFSMTMLAENYNHDALNMTVGSGSSGSLAHVSGSG